MPTIRARLLVGAPKVLWSTLLTAALAAGSVQAQNLQPIITFDQTHPLVENSDRVPMVRVFANGEVIVHRRAGNTRPGRYTLNLTTAELAEVIALAEQAGVVQFDVAQLEAAASESAGLFHVSDPTTTILTVNRVQNSSELSVGDGTDLSAKQIIRIDDVSVKAAMAPTAPGIQPINALHSKMVELFSEAGA